MDRTASAPKFSKNHNAGDIAALDRTRPTRPYLFTINHPHQNGRLPSGGSYTRLGDNIQLFASNSEMKIAFLILNGVFIVALTAFGALAERAHEVISQGYAKELILRGGYSENKRKELEGLLFEFSNRGRYYTRLAFVGSATCALNAVFILLLGSSGQATKPGEQAEDTKPDNVVS
ncbi:MAG: hypothetical protein H7A54_09680 [Akkermansiaceae bacterium]|nr:hypothetical protein [Verrucomicrobiae bacterium]MCP5553904.1 hypothetical protein [Akkermansiaceae bacterium]